MSIASEHTRLAGPVEILNVRFAADVLGLLAYEVLQIARGSRRYHPKSTPRYS